MGGVLSFSEGFVKLAAFVGGVWDLFFGGIAMLSAVFFLFVVWHASTCFTAGTSTLFPMLWITNALACFQ